MDFKERLKKEKEELGERLEKLNDFIGSEGFNKIDSLQQSLLVVQSGAMLTYFKCLNERLNNL